MRTIAPQDAAAELAKMMDAQDAAKEVVVLPPPDTAVTLPGGLKGVTEAEVKELTGEDEEYVSRQTTVSRKLNAVLMRGVVRIGDRPMEKEFLDDLLSGDREQLLIGIRVATFGPEIEIGNVCNDCGEFQTFPVDLITDVPIKQLNSAVEWEVPLRKGTAVVALPTGAAQRKIMDASVDKTMAELNTILLAECVLAVNNRASAGEATVRSLGMKDRQTIIKSILENSPGPQLGEVSMICEHCEGKVPLPVAITDLFPF